MDSGFEHFFWHSLNCMIITVRIQPQSPILPVHNHPTPYRKTWIMIARSYVFHYHGTHQTEMKYIHCTHTHEHVFEMHIFNVTLILNMTHKSSSHSTICLVWRSTIKNHLSRYSWTTQIKWTRCHCPDGRVSFIKYMLSESSTSIRIV